MSFAPSYRLPALWLEGTGSHGPESLWRQPYGGGVTEFRRRNDSSVTSNACSFKDLRQKRCVIGPLAAAPAWAAASAISAGSSGCIAQVDGGPEREENG